MPELAKYRNCLYVSASFALGLVTMGAGTTVAICNANDLIIDRFRWFLGGSILIVGLVNAYFLNIVMQLEHHQKFHPISTHRIHTH